MINLLPTEIIKIILESLDTCRDVFACMRSCRRIFLIARQYIFHNAKSLERILYWAIQVDQLNTLKSILDAGVDLKISMPVHHGRTPLQKGEPAAKFYARWPPQSILSDRLPPPDPIIRRACYLSLHLAAREGRVDSIRALLQSGHEIDCSSTQFCCNVSFPYQVQHRPWYDWFFYHSTPLHVAICAGQSEAAQCLIASGASIHGEEPAYRSPTPLLPRTASPVRTGATALHIACACGDLSTAKFLVDEGYIKDIDVQDIRGYTPLWYAFLRGKWGCFHWLLAVGADINLCVARSPYGAPLTESGQQADYYASLLDFAIASRRWDDGLRLINADIDPRTTASGFRNPLHSCCHTYIWPPCHSTPEMSEDRRLQLSLMERLLKSGLGIDSRINKGYTPLHYAVEARDVLSAKFLIENGGNIHLQLEDGTPALWLACGMRPTSGKALKRGSCCLKGVSPEIVRLLLEAGSNLDEPRQAGRSLLQCVCKTYPISDKAPIVRLLVRHTKDFDSDLELKRDVIYSLLATGDGRSLKVVLERVVSAQLWTSKEDLLDLFQLVLWRRDTTCLQYLLSIDTENQILHQPTNILDLLGSGTPRYTGPCEEMMLILLRAGAHQNFRKYPCTIMLHLAVARNFSSVVRWFLKNGVAVDHQDAESKTALAYAKRRSIVNALLAKGADPWASFDHSKINIEDTPVGMAIITNCYPKLEQMLFVSKTTTPPCAITGAIELTIIMGVRRCFNVIKNYYPREVKNVLTSDAAAGHLLNMLARFWTSKEPTKYNPFFNSVADSVVNIMSQMLNANPDIDLEAEMETSADAAIAKTSIIRVIENILRENNAHGIRQRRFNECSKRVQVFWMPQEPDIIILPARRRTPSLSSLSFSSSSSSSSTSSSSSSGDQSPVVSGLPPLVPLRTYNHPIRPPRLSHHRHIHYHPPPPPPLRPPHPGHHSPVSGSDASSSATVDSDSDSVVSFGSYGSSSDDSSVAD